MNRIYCEFGKFTLEVDDPLRWDAVKRLTGKVKEIAPGRYEMALSAQNLVRVHKYFERDVPIVVTGQKFIDQLKEKLAAYKKWRSDVQEIKQKENYPVEPNGKFFPYAHQTRIVGTVLQNPFAGVLADAGTGKTGSIGRAIEIALGRGEVKRGSVLISAPLSILHTSWEDDLRKFTSLRPGILWTPQSNRTLYHGEKKILKDFGDCPKGKLTTKTKSSILFYNEKTKQVTKEFNPLLDDPKDFEKYQATYKTAVMPDGSEIPFGQMTGKQTSKEKTRESYVEALLKSDQYDLYLINHDSVRLYSDLLKAQDFEWIVVDESTKIKSTSSQVSRAHVDISWKASRRNILSGTPSPNGLIDLWQQFYFLDRGLTLEPNHRDFLNEYFKPEVVAKVKTKAGTMADALKYVVKSDQHKEALISRVRGAGIFLKQRDCIDLPPRTDLKRIAFMNKEQVKAYEDMESELVAELYDEKTGIKVEADALNALSKITKLRQITSGFLINNRANETEQAKVFLTDNPKIQELDSFLEELGDEKVVVCAQFRDEIAALLKRHQNLNAKAIQGGTPLADRTETIRKFQETDEIKMVVLQPQAAAHGITLTAASHLIFLSLDYNFEYYYQVAKRIERIGQKRPIFITTLLARFPDGSPTIDETLVSILNQKGLDQDALFSSGQNQMELARELISTIITQRRERNG